METKKGFYFLGHKTIMCELLDAFYPLFLIIGVPIIVLTLFVNGCVEVYTYCESLYDEHQKIKEEEIYLKKTISEKKEFINNKEKNLDYILSTNFLSYFNDANFSFYGFYYIKEKITNNEMLYNIVKDGLYYNNLNKSLYRLDNNDNFIITLNDKKLFFNKNDNFIKKISFTEKYISYSELQSIYDNIIENEFIEIYYTYQYNNDITQNYIHKFKKNNIIITLSYTSYVDKALFKIETEKK